MSAPKTAITRLDLSMTYGEFNLEAQRRKYIGLQVMPALGVAVEAADFAKIEVEELLTKVEDTRRAPKATYSRDDWNWRKDSYAVEEHGVEEIVDDATIERYDDVIRAENVSTQRAINRVLQALENDIANTLFTSGFSYKTAVGTAWSTPASATPIDDIDGAIESVKTQIGEMPNTIVMSDHALRMFKRTDQVENLLKYNSEDDPANIAIADTLRRMFEVENVYIARAFKNSAQRGLTASFSRFWDSTMCGVYRINDDGLEGDLESPDPGIGRTIFRTESANLPGADDGEASLIMEEYREEARRGGVIRARNKRVVKMIHEEAGHLLTGVTA